MRRALVALAVLTTPAAAQDVPARLGQTVGVGGPRVRPNRILEDSRCPPTVTCFWAGRLVVRVMVIGGAWRKQLDLEPGVPQHVADGMLTLTEATPASRPERGTRPYRFRFLFQGGL